MKRRPKRERKLGATHAGAESAAKAGVAGAVIAIETTASEAVADWARAGKAGNGTEGRSVAEKSVGPVEAETEAGTIADEHEFGRTAAVDGRPCGECDGKMEPTLHEQ